GYDSSKGAETSIYRYIGEDDRVDLSGAVYDDFDPDTKELWESVGSSRLAMQDYGNTELWKQVNLLDAPAEVRAYTDNSSITAGGALKITADSTQTIEALVISGSMAASGGSTGVAVSGAGAGAVNHISTDVRAGIDGDGLTGIRVGSLTLTATDTSAIKAITGAASLAAGFGGTGVAVAIGIAAAHNTISNDVTSSIVNVDDSITATTGAINISALEASSISSLTTAASLSVAFGGTGVAVSGAGAAAINLIENRTNAYVDSSTLSTTSGIGDVIISAADTSSIDATVAALSAAVAGGSVGVGVSIGAAFASNTIGELLPTGNSAQVRAYVEDSTIIAAGDVKLSAISSETITSRILAGSVAIAGGGVGVGVGGSGVLAINLLSTDINAYIGGLRSVVTGRSVSLTADDTSKIMAYGGAAAITGGFGGVGVAVSIGVSLAHNEIDNNVAAYVLNSSVTATGTSGGIVVNAIENAQINAVSAAAALAVAIGGVGVSVSGAGAEASNVVLTRTNAYVQDSVLSSQGTVDVMAKSQSAAPPLNSLTTAVVGDAGTFAGNLDDAGATDADNEDSKDTNERDVDIIADNSFLKQLSNYFTTQGILNSGSLAVTIRTQGSEWSVTDRITGSSYVITKDGSTFNVTMPTIGAAVIAASAAVAGGAVGVGVSIGLSFATNVIGWGIDLDVTADYSTADAPGTLVKNDTVKVESGVHAGNIYEYLGKNQTPEPGATTVELKTQDYGNTDLWRRVDLEEQSAEVRAYLRDSSVSADGGLSVTATSDQSIDAVVVAGSAAASGAGVGVSVSGAGAGAVNRISNDVQAYIQGDGATGVSASSIALMAKDTSSISAVTGAASLAAAFGAVGVGVSIGVAGAFNEISNDVAAYIFNAENVVSTTAGGDITIKAVEAATINAVTSAASLGVAIGGVGVAVSGAGAVATNIILTKTNAYVSDSTLDSGGNVVLSASDTSTINATVAASSVALAGGGVGVGVSIGAAFARNLVGHTLFDQRTPAQVRAYVDNSILTVNGNLTQTATANETINATVLSGSAAISAGVVGVAVSGSGVVAVNKIATEVQSYIDGSTVDAGSVALSTNDTSQISADAGAAAVAASFGGVGVAISIGAALAENQISNEIESYINNAEVTTHSGDLSLEAIEDASIKAQTAAAAVSAAVGAYGVAVSGAGAEATNVILTKTNAYINESSLVSAENLLIKAESDSTIDAIVASTAASLGGGVVGISGSIGLSAARNLIGYDLLGVRRPAEVQAYVTNSDIQATGDIIQTAKAIEIINATVQAGSVAVSAGLVAGAASGAGAGIENKVATKVKAYIDNTSVVGKSVNADNITLTAQDTSKIFATVEAASMAASVGVIGKSVSVGVAIAKNDISNEVEAYIKSSSVNTTTGNLTLQALEKADIKATSVAASAAASAGLFSLSISGGGASAFNTINNSTKAYVSGSTLDLFGNLTVESRDISTSVAKVASLSQSTGILSISMGGSVANALVTSTIEAKTNSTTIDAGGAILISATAQPSAEVEALGVNSGSMAVGASTATANVSPTVTAFVDGSGNTITAPNLTVTASHILPNAGSSAKAAATGSSGGLIGVNATASSAANNTQVNAYVAANSTLDISGSASILATLNSSQYSMANGKAYGLLAAGGNSSTASSDSSTSAYLADGVKATGGMYRIWAGGKEDNLAQAISGTGGFVAVSASEAYTMSTNSTNVSVGSGNTTRNINVDSLTIIADHTAKFDATADSSSGGVVDASGANIRNDISTTVDAVIGKNAVVVTKDLAVEASNRIRKDVRSGYNLISASGGVGSFPAGSSKSYIKNTTQVIVDDGASVSVTDNFGVPDTFTLTAHNDVSAFDRAKIDAGGAVATAKTESYIYNDTNSAEVKIYDAALQSAGSIDITSWTREHLETQASAKTYGLAGYAQGVSIAHTNVTNSITVHDGATIEAVGDIRLNAGNLNDLVVQAGADLWNKTAFPIPSGPTADATINQNCYIDITTDAWIGSNKDVYLEAYTGNHSVVGSWSYQDSYLGLAEDIANGIGSLFGADPVSLKVTGGGSYDNQNSYVNVDGIVESGLNNRQFLSIDENIDNNNLVMSSTSELEFRNSTGQDVLTRSKGSWLADGFAKGQFIQISGASADLDGAYLIESVDVTTITLNAKTPLGGNVGTTSLNSVVVRHLTMSGNPSLDFHKEAPNATISANSITRSSGSWVEDGFAVNQHIIVDGSGANDNFYIISGISAGGKTLILNATDSVLASDVSSVAGATVRVVAAPSALAVGSPKTELDFNASSDTITRTHGSWSDDGFVINQTLVVSGTVAGKNDGTYTIKSVTADTLTLKTLSTETVSSSVSNGTNTATTSLDFSASNTITRSDSGGDWTADFAVGDVIVVSGTANNNGSYTIASCSATTITVQTLRSQAQAAPSTVTAANGTTTVNHGKLSMTFDAVDKTITRDDGLSWLVSGFNAGQAINVAGSVNNSGCYTILSISGSIIKLVATETLVDEAKAFSVTLRGAAQENYSTTVNSLDLTHIDPRGTITRADADWSVDGFTAGKIIAVKETGSNNRSYQIDSIDGKILYIDESQDVATETHTAHIVINIPGTSITIHEDTMEGNPDVSFTHVYGGRDVISRATGSWLVDEFKEGQTINVSGTIRNDGQYQIATISTDGKTIGLHMADNLFNESVVSGVTVIGLGITDGITNPVLKTENLATYLATEMQRLQDLKGSYTENPVAIAGYDSDLTQIRMQAEELGLLVDGVMKDRYDVTYIELPNITASSGSVKVNSINLTGSGYLIGNGDTSIEIVNNNPYYLRVNDITIPGGNGGQVLFNGLEISSDRTSFQHAATETGIDPVISISSLFNPTGSNYPTAAAPDINVVGSISNLSGSLKIYNDKGSVIVKNTGSGSNSILAKDVDITSGRNVVISSDGFYHVGGDPAGDQDGSTVAGNNIFMTARYLNLNGTVQSGRADRSVTLDSTSNNAIKTFKADLTKANIRYLVLTKNIDDGIKTRYDRQTDQIIVDSVAIEGGFMQLTGQIMNTNEGNANLKAVDGYGNISIDNQTEFDVVINRIDTGGKGIEGTIKIVDTAPAINMKTGMPTGDKPIITTYTRVGDKIQVNGVDDPAGSSRTSTYEPLLGQRYVYLTGTDQTKHIYREYISASFWGADWLARDPGQQPDQIWTVPAGKPVALPEGRVFAWKTDIEQKDLPPVTLGGEIPDPNASYSYVSSKGWWIFSVDYYHYVEAFLQGERKYTNVTVAADYSIGIEFIGYDQGTVTINSTTDVVLHGTIANQIGTTSITSTDGAISNKTGSNGAVVNGSTITLSAATGIGLAKYTDPDTGVITEASSIITNLNGGYLDAISAAGDVVVDELDGDMVVGTIKATTGNVVLSADKSIVSNSISSQVTGESIDLSSRYGGIGGSVTSMLRIDSGTAKDNKLNVSAMKDIYLEEIARDLHLDSIQSITGDVYLLVDHGDLIDSNNNDKRDLRTEAQLLSLWNDMQLTLATGAGAASAQNIAAYEGLKTREYQSYWNYREQQADPSVYDGSFQVHLSAQELDYYQANDWTPSKIAD
ncbi:MAG: hypothetical protein GY934_04255, partial [Gammaproteobacteria bacterium]|nr:hypothetical protein [Gammaproteobacteria bacterium]